jgi:hypothetical protein
MDQATAMNNDLILIVVAESRSCLRLLFINSVSDS